MTAPQGFDFEVAVRTPARMQPGLQRLRPGVRQLTDLDPTGDMFSEKLAVLSRHAEGSLVCAEGFDPEPALRVLAAQAEACGALALSADGDGVNASLIGWRVDWNGGLHALHSAAHAEAGRALAAIPERSRMAGLLSLAVHEDLAIVDGRHATLPWMAVCVPSHWAPAEKVGRSFATVHGPVADNAVLIAAAEHLSRLVCAPQRWERFVWNVTTHALHDEHPHRHTLQPWKSDGNEIVAQARWRTEHQTFIPMPDLQLAVFTIHVAVQPLEQAIATAAHAGALHDALASMTDAVADYKGVTDARAPLLAWLAARRHATP